MSPDLTNRAAPPSGRVKGWCPGALAPMMSGDGLLVRLRLSGGVMSLELAERIAQLAQRFGNGALNLSGRGNLQLRGVSDAAYPELIAALSELNLLDSNEKTEAVRNVLISPTTGLDQTAFQDVRPIGAALEAEITANPRFWQLPPKFSFIIEDGGAFPLDSVAADIRFVAVNTSEFGLQLGNTSGFFGIWKTRDVVPVAVRVVGLFLDSSLSVPLRHMQDLIARTSTAHICSFLGCELHATVEPNPVQKQALFGQNMDFYGLGVAFGFLRAAQLEALVSAARNLAARELRLTPWRALLLVRPKPDRSADAPADHDMLAGLVHAGFITDPNDPRLASAACVGQPDCASASVAAPKDALVLAGLTPELVHVSGCAKGCAHPKPAAFTFVGRNGLYDLVENGKADGVPVLTGLLPGDLTRALGARIAKAELERSLAL